MTWCGQTTRTNQIVNKWSSEVQISCIKKIIGHSPEWLMPCTCILVCTCSRVQVTPMDIPNKQICTPVMFFVCVVCSCTNGIEITCAACKPLCHTPTTSYLITQSFGLDSLTYVPNVFESSVQLCSWYLTSIWKCELWSFCSPTHSRRNRYPLFCIFNQQRQTSKHSSASWLYRELGLSQ